jgi:ParB-like chromosome segregation protein Spo0J
MKRQENTLQLSPEEKSARAKNLQIRLMPVDKIMPDPRNTRTHSDVQIAGVAASIQEFGWTSPVLVRPDGVLIAGHARLLAARKLGLKEIPAIELSGLNEAQCRALVIADNQLAVNAAWDDDLLRSELAALRDQDFDLDLIGFNAEELARLLAEQDIAGGMAELIDPDALPKTPKVAVTAPGDLWLLGDHRLYCGDTVNQEAIDVALGGSHAVMTFTDLSGNTLRDAAKKIEAPAFLQEFFGHLIARCRGAIYVCMSPGELHNFHQAFTTAGGHWSAFIVWADDRSSRGPSDYRRQYESILYGWPEGSDRYWRGSRDQGDVWTIQSPTANRKHPTAKPVELVERAVENSSRPGDSVLDPFAGSGTALIACERLGRRASLIERNPRNVDLICKRWEQYSGRSATRHGDGRPFAGMPSDRHSAQSRPLRLVEPNASQGDRGRI